jgi:chemotaxis protein methyltransferase CheR
MDVQVYGDIKTSVKKLLNIDLVYYKDEQMKRRLDSWLVRSGVPTWTDYLKHIAIDNQELSRFRDYLTINVSEFFRDIERWQSLRQQIIPQLLKDSAHLHASTTGLRIWSAGCSIGDEAYTLAIMMDEIAPRLNHFILASDIDRGALQKAKARGPYTADDIRNISPAQRNTYFDVDGSRFYVKEKIAQRITFREQNLMTDSFENNFDLIVCRNVIIYFTNEAKSLLYPKFQAALRPGGVLFLGGTEIIPRPTDIGLRNQGVSFYIKV